MIKYLLIQRYKLLLLNNGKELILKEYNYFGYKSIIDIVRSVI